MCRSAKLNLTHGISSAPRSNACSLAGNSRDHRAGLGGGFTEESEKNENETLTESQEIGEHVIRLSLFSRPALAYESERSR